MSAKLARNVRAGNTTALACLKQAIKTGIDHDENHEGEELITFINVFNVDPKSSKNWLTSYQSYREICAHGRASCPPPSTAVSTVPKSNVCPWRSIEDTSDAGECYRFAFMQQALLLRSSILECMRS